MWLAVVVLGGDGHHLAGHAERLTVEQRGVDVVHMVLNAGRASLRTQALWADCIVAAHWVIIA